MARQNTFDRKAVILQTPDRWEVTLVPRVWIVDPEEWPLFEALQAPWASWQLGLPRSATPTTLTTVPVSLSAGHA